MVNWDKKDELGVCTSDTEYRQVQEVCHHIGISCHRVEFVKEYWNNVFKWVWFYITLTEVCSDFLQEYQRGRTPNPDILCNQHIKFGVFNYYIINKMMMDKIATGHYARLKKKKNGSES